LTLAVFACCGWDALALSVDPSDLPQIQQDMARAKPDGELALAVDYLTGHGVPQDLRQAAYWYERAAGHGDPVAQNQIGYCYQTGLGVSQDAARAAHWYQLSASSGLIEGKVNLAIAYLYGSGVEKNPETAKQLLIEAAQKGSGTASAYLGEMYLYGTGVPEDTAAAEKWYEKAIKLHSYLGAFRMGKLLSRPNANPEDLSRALSLFLEAASEGFVPAMHSAGLIIVNHPDLGASHDEALSMLNEAAKGGEWRSSLVLGVLARDGKWEAQDMRAAYFHFRVAALQGGGPANDLLRNDFAVLSQKISSEERAKLDTEASRWAQVHNRPLVILYQDRKGGSKFGAFALAMPPSGSHAGLLIPVASF
jgi:TPR repeat protein